MSAPQPQPPGSPPRSPPRSGPPSSQFPEASSIGSVRVAVGSVSSDGGNGGLNVNEPHAPPNYPAEFDLREFDPREDDRQQDDLRDRPISSNPDDGPVIERLVFHNETGNTMYGEESAEEMEERAKREAEHRASQAIKDFDTKFSSTPDESP